MLVRHKLPQTKPERHQGPARGPGDTDRDTDSRQRHRQQPRGTDRDTDRRQTDRDTGRQAAEAHAKKSWGLGLRDHGLRIMRPNMRFI